MNGPVTDFKAPLCASQMLGDPDSLLAEYDAVDEKPEVAVIHPGDSPEEAEIEPFADDCEFHGYQDVPGLNDKKMMPYELGTCRSSQTWTSRTKPHQLGT